MIKITRKSSQIATILTLVIALIFLFIVMAINLGKISHKKTAISNACDSSALFLASSLGSVANAIKQEIGIYGDSDSACDLNLALILGILLVIAAVIATIVTAGAGSPSLLAAVSIASSAIAGSLLIAGEIIAAYTEPGLMQEIQIKFQNMTAEQRLFEAAMQSSLFVTIDDGNWVPDLYDADRDGRKMPGELDKIPQFSHWYLQRLNYLPRVGELIEAFFQRLFTNDAGTRIFDLDYEDNDPTKDATFAYLYAGDDADDVDGRIRPWLEGSFKDFLHLMWDSGYGVYFEKENRALTDDELDWLIEQMSLLEDDLAKEIYNVSKDLLISGFETWPRQFYNTGTEPEDEDWYDRMGEWMVKIDNWIVELQDMHVQALSCITNCNAQACSETDADGNCTSCGGDWLNCCELCGDAGCPPSFQCDVPTGTSPRNCCDSGCRLNPLFLCDDTEISTYITYLEKLNNALDYLRNEIKDLVEDADDAKNNFWSRRAIYVWKDRVLNDLGEEIEAESPAHMVYVEVNPVSSDFKFPYYKQWTDWFGFLKCQGVREAEGEIDFTVARYDEDMAKSGPLANFWRFRFRRNAWQNENAGVVILRMVADKFYNRLHEGKAVSDLNNLASQANYGQLRRLAFNYGIAAKVRVHYGPGYTYDPDSSAFPGEASKRNKDIYIVTRFR